MEDGEEPSPVADDEGRIVTLALAVPGLPGSRAEFAHEETVSTVDVLLFKDDKFYYWAVGSNIAPGDAEHQQKFNVRLPKGEFGVVVLANARAALAAITGITPATVSSAGITRATVLNGLVQAVQADDNAPYEKWTGVHARIPMWGYYKDGASTILEIDENPATLQPVNLTRAIVRVDVSVKDVPPPGPAPRDKFSLASVHLYNYSRAGQIAPKVSTIPGNLDGYDGEQWKNLAIPAPAGIKAAAPHVPGYSDLKVKGPVEYVIDDDYTVPHAYEFRKEIYTYESTVEAVKMKNTCLVIGGYYDGNPAPTYYRVDFVNSLKERIPLLRNYRYNVEIQEVNGHGYPTPEDAYANDPVNIVVTIVPWNDGAMNDVVFNDQHYLSVNKSELVFYTNGDAKSLEAITDFPAGWAVESLPPWLTATAPIPPKGDAGVQTTLTLKAGVLDSSDPARESFFYIVAGNLKKKITVRQLDEAEFSLEVDPGELVFFASQTTPKQVGIFPIPAADGTNYSIEFTPAGGLSWPAFPAFVSPMSHVGLIPVNRALPASNTLYGAVQVTLKGTDGRSVTKVINVRQLNREMEFHAFPDNPYPVEGGDDLEFTVSSEGKWRLLPKVGDTYLTLKDPIEVVGSGHHPPVTSFTYPFKLTNNVSSYAPRTATIKVNLDNLVFSPAISFDIVQLGTPPYLVITEPAAVGDPPVHEHDFAADPPPKTVTFKTNAGWTFSSDGNFDNVISKVEYASNEIDADDPQTGSTVPTSEVVEAVIFTPTTATGTAVAGKNETKVTFTTVNPDDPALDASGMIIFYRFVPADWTFGSATPSTIPAEGGDVTITAHTNLVWYGQQESEGKLFGYPGRYPADRVHDERRGHDKRLAS